MVRKNVAEILHHHVTFELEAIDRMYLNAYVPSLQTGGGLVWFLKTQLDCRVPSTAMVAPMSYAFVAAIERFVEAQGIDLVTFQKGQRKDDVAHQYLATFAGDEGVLFIGKAQEKASVFRTEKRCDAAGKKYPWIIRSTAMVNHYYIYILDRDFGPLFLKFPCQGEIMAGGGGRGGLITGVLLPSDSVNVSFYEAAGDCQSHQPDLICQSAAALVKSEVPHPSIRARGGDQLSPAQ
jgi:hypothetical protein